VLANRLFDRALSLLAFGGRGRAVSEPGTFVLRSRIE